MTLSERYFDYSKNQIAESFEHIWKKGYGVAYVKDLDCSDDFLQSPLVRQYMRLLELCRKGIKLTPSGFLPNKVVKEIYPLGPKDPFTEMALSKLGNHINCVSLCHIWELFLKTGLAKKRKGMLLLTKAGEKVVGKPDKLFRHLMKALSTTADPYYVDGYEIGPFNDLSQLLCVLLSKSNGQFVSISHCLHEYGQRHYRLRYFFNEIPWETIPGEISESFFARTIERFLAWMGLIEFEDEEYLQGLTFRTPEKFRTTELFTKFIGLNEPQGMDDEAYMEEDPEYDDGEDDDDLEEPIVLSPREMKEFLDMIGADTSDFPEEEELDRLDAIRVAEMISQNFIDPNKQGKYRS